MNSQTKAKKSVKQGFSKITTLSLNEDIESTINSGAPEKKATLAAIESALAASKTGSSTQKGGKLRILSPTTIMKNKMSKMERVQHELKGLEDLVKSKADTKELNKMGEQKSNKFDTEFILKCVSLQHKQLQHLACLLAETQRSLLEDHKTSVAEL